MGGKGRICHMLLTVICMTALTGCRINLPEDRNSEKAMLTVRLSGSSMTNRSVMPDEDVITDAWILVYDDSGMLEAELKGHDAGMRLTSGRSYTVLAYANMGRIPVSVKLEEMMNYRHCLESPYDYENGLPMCGIVSDLHMDQDTVLDMRLERLMSKVSIKVDRSRLGEGIEMNVSRVLVGNCPAEVLVFQESRLTDSRECFDVGFEREDTAPLNSLDADGKSDALSLYLLENMQGRFSADSPASESGKVFSPDDVRKDICSYIEMEFDYHSDSLYYSDKALIYRFYIGDGLNSLDVERNCHYHITVCPEGDGLSEDIWRIEKSGLHSYVQEILLSEERVLLDYRGKSAVLEAAVLPPHAYLQEVLWESSDPEVVYVDLTGRICALREGECIITCSSTDGSGVSASCLVRNEFAPPRFASYPVDKYINGDIGDTVRLWCEVFPPDTPFDVGLEYLEDDKATGIYDYVIDEDGHGVTLVLTGPGSGLIYMEAGEPVNDAALYFIEVNMPDDG